MEYNFSSGAVRLLGRAFEYNGMVGLSFSASGVEFVCEDGFEVFLKADCIVEAADADIHYARYAVFADGKRIADRRLEKMNDSLQVVCAGRHIFRLIKLSESEDSTMFILNVLPLKGQLLPTPEKEKRIEFIGDSITCGYGVDGCFAEGETYTTATEDASIAYAYLTAQKLDWDCSLVSKSGSGIISGYDGEGRRNTQNLFPPYYGSAGCSMAAFEDGKKPEEISWSFESAPDIIVINLGTNDKSYCRPDCGISAANIEEEDIASVTGTASGVEGDAGYTPEFISRVYERRCSLFRDEYVKFLKLVRSHNPESFIICSLGIMEDALNCEVEAAVRVYSEQTGDRNIEWFEFEKQDIERDGIGTDYHPSAKTQADRAEKLYEHICKHFS